MQKKTEAFRVAFSTLGCKVNQYESAAISEELEHRGFSVVPFNTQADCYIVNTCTVTAATNYQSRQLIRRASKTNPSAIVIATGCYAQIDPNALAAIPGVTLVVGNTEKEKLPDVIERLAEERGCADLKIPPYPPLKRGVK
ncbi:MAG: hypothetical protein JXA41_01810 [Deltaproteobacteria bacterium]|nr:hypothetical protein [Deltaproteobacteria bacterium]